MNPILAVLFALALAYAALLVWENHKQNEHARLVQDIVARLNLTTEQVRRVGRTFAQMGVTAQEASRAFENLGRALKGDASS